MANRRTRKIIIVGVITYFFLELISFIGIKTVFTQAKLPQFFTDPKDTLVFPFAYADLREEWGVWHFDHEVKVPYGCLNLHYNPNSVGAYDIDRKEISSDSNRCIVLGDSFMEGFGVSFENRLSTLLEKATGKPMLNFACADMGSTQEYLVYKHLASKYTHNALVIGILPANDFLNDDIGFDSVQRPIRYKPYWQGTYPKMSLHYYADDITKSQFTPEAFASYKSTSKYKLRYLLENTTCWFNLFYFFRQRTAAADFVKMKTHGKNKYSGYYDYTKDDVARLQQSLLEIRKIATDKKVIITTIPVAEDFERLRKENSAPPLVNTLKEFCTVNNITYVDLLTTAPTEVLQHPGHYYFDCDIHWNDKGNRWGYEMLLPLLR